MGATPMYRALVLYQFLARCDTARAILRAPPPPLDSCRLLLWQGRELHADTDI